MAREALCSQCGYVAGHWVGGTSHETRRFRPNWPLAFDPMLHLKCPGCGTDIMHEIDLKERRRVTTG